MPERQRKKYFKSIARALIDFNELNPTSPIHLLVESLNSKKTLPLETLPTILRNMGEYLTCIPTDIGISPLIWTPVMQGIETLFRRLVLVLNSLDDPDYLPHTMVAVLKTPNISKVCGTERGPPKPLGLTHSVSIPFRFRHRFFCCRAFWTHSAR